MPTLACAPWQADQPDDVLAAVMGHLGRKDALAVGLVCKAWAAQLDRVLPSIRTTPSCLPRTLQRFRGLETIEIVFQSAAPTPDQLHALAGTRTLVTLRLRNAGGPPTTLELSGLGALAAGRARLRTLDISRFLLHSDCGLAELAATADCRPPSLERLALRGCGVGDVGFFAAAVAPLAASLTELDVESLVVPSPAAYAGLQALRNLRSLSLRHAGRLGLDVCQHLTAMTGLTQLDLSRQGLDAYDATSFTDDSLRLLAHSLRGLRVLSLAGHGRVTDAGVALLGLLPCLQSLDLRQPLELGMMQPTHQQQQQQQQHQQQPPAAALAMGAAAIASQVADAGSASPRSLTGAGVALLLSRTQSATALSLSGASVCAASCQAMARLEGLTRLAVSDCSALQDADVYTLSPLGLTSLSLSGCGPGLTDIGVAQLVRSFPKLASLGLCHASRRVTRFGLAAIGALGSLEELILSGCEAVNDALLAHLLPQLPQLASLRLADCSHVTDVGCATIAACLPQLTCLTLEHCVRVTEVGLRWVERDCRQLQHLNVHGTAAGRSVRSWKGFRMVQVVTDKPFWWMNER